MGCFCLKALASREPDEELVQHPSCQSIQQRGSRSWQVRHSSLPAPKCRCMVLSRAGWLSLLRMAEQASQIHNVLSGLGKDGLKTFIRM